MGALEILFIIIIVIIIIMPTLNLPSFHHRIELALQEPWPYSILIPSVFLSLPVLPVTELITEQHQSVGPPHPVTALRALWETPL